MSHKLLHTIAALPKAVAALALFCLMVLTFTDVVLRSVFNAPIEVAADMTRLLMAITIFAVMPTLSARGGQITVDLMDSVYDRLGLTRWLNALVSVGCGIILFWPAKRVFDLAERSRSYGDVMEYLGLPVHYVGWFIAVLTGFTAVALLWRGIALVIAPHLVQEPHNG